MAESMPCDLVRDLVVRATPSVRRCFSDQQLAEMLGVRPHSTLRMASPSYRSTERQAHRRVERHSRLAP